MRQTIQSSHGATGLVALLFLLSADIGSAAGQSASPEVRDAARHVVTLQAYDQSGRRTEQGSGFHLSGGRIATNSHVVAGAARVEIFDAGGAQLGTARFARAVDARLDLAILPAPDPAARGLALSPSTPEVGDPVWVYGSPQGLGGTMSTGIVSAIRTRSGRRMVQISAPISRGSSGGPVLNARGQVIGVTVASIVEGQNLNFAVPSTELALLNAAADGHLDFPGASGAAISAGPDWYRSTAQLGPGKSFSGVIEASDFTHDGRPYDLYWFEGGEGERVEFVVSSSAIDPYVVVTDPQAPGGTRAWTRVDDDGGAGTDAHLSVELPGTGPYIVLVSSYKGQVGPYEIMMADDAVAPGGERRPVGVPPERWKFIARNASDARLYYDRQTMAERDGSLKVWVYTQYPEAREPAGFDASKALFEIRCNAQEYRLNQYLLLRDTEIIGSDGSAGGGEWSAVPPDSVAEGLLTSLCS